MKRACVLLALFILMPQISFAGLSYQFKVNSAVMNEFGDMIIDSKMIRWKKGIKSSISLVSDDNGVLLLKLIDNPKFYKRPYSYLLINTNEQPAEVKFCNNNRDIESNNCDMIAYYNDIKKEQPSYDSSSLHYNPNLSMQQIIQQQNKATEKKYKEKRIPQQLSGEDQALLLQYRLSMKNVRPDKDAVSKCSYNNDLGRYYITCSIYFPDKNVQGGALSRYIHDIESYSAKLASTLRSEGAPSFLIQSLLNHNNLTTPICNFIYDKEVDQISPRFMLNGL